MDAETIHNHSRDYPHLYGALWAQPKASLLATPPPPCICPTELCCAGFRVYRARHAGTVEDVERIGGAKALQSCRVLGASKAGRAAAGYRPGGGVFSPVISSWYAQQERRQRSNKGTYNQVRCLLQIVNIMHCKAKAWLQSDFDEWTISPQTYNIYKCSKDSPLDWPVCRTSK